MVRALGWICLSVCGWLSGGQGWAGQVQEDVSGDLTWPVVMQAAFEHHPEVKRAQAAWEQAKGAKMVVRATALPQLRASGITVPALIFLEVNQVLLDGSVLPGIRAVDALESAAEINLVLTWHELLGGVRLLWAEALRDQREAELRAEFQEELEKNLLRVQGLEESGRLTRAELLKADTEVRLGRERLREARARAEQSRLDLLAGVHFPPQDPRGRRPLAGHFEEGPAEVEALSEMIARAMKQRLDLKLARQVQLSAGEKLRAARAGYWPSLALRAKGEFELWAPRLFDDLSTRQDPEDASRTLQKSRAVTAVDLTWRVFDGGETRGSVMMAQTELVSREVVVKYLENFIPAQVKVAWERWNLARRGLREALAGQPASQTLELGREAWEQGKLSRVELSRIEHDVLEQRLALLRAQFTMDVATVLLYRATGGWLLFETPTPAGVVSQ